MIKFNVEIVIGRDIYPYQVIEAANIKDAYVIAYRNIYPTTSKPYDQLEEHRLGIVAFVYTNDPSISNNCPACDANDLFEITQNGIKTCQCCGHQQMIHNWLGKELSETRTIDCPRCDEVFDVDHSIAYCPKCHHRNVACETCLGFVSLKAEGYPDCSQCVDGSQFREWLTDEERIIRNGQ